MNPFRQAACAAFLLLAIATDSSASSHCLPHADMLRVLEAQYKEQPVALGTTNSGGLVEVLSSGDGATWSIIVTGANGLSCLASSGQGWHRVAPKNVEQGT